MCIRDSLQQVLDLLREIDGGAPVGDGDVALAGQGFEGHEEMGRAVSFVFVVHPRRLARCGWQWHARFRHPLLADFIKTDDRIGRVVGSGIDFQHILHRTDKLGVGVRWNHPVPTQPRFKGVF